MSYAENHFDETVAAPLINMFQLISAPMISFLVVTPLCMWNGYSVPTSFLMGWVFGLVAMITLIAGVSSLCAVQKVGATAEQAAQANIAVFQTYFEANRNISAVAEWDLDALADRLDASYQSAVENRFA